MNEADKVINELEESIKEFEATILGAIPDAENGNEQVAQKLNELEEDLIISCRDAVIVRLAEYYCLSLETSHKAYRLCEWLKTHDRGFNEKNFGNCLILSGALPAVDKSLDYYDQNVRKNRIGIGVLAEGGYALAQYWHGRLIEDGNASPLQGHGIADALKYYRKAADQGVVIAKKQFVECAKRYNRCPYCGGEFKGLFGKKCKQCGKPKDY